MSKRRNGYGSVAEMRRSGFAHVRRAGRLLDEAGGDVALAIKHGIELGASNAVWYLAKFGGPDNV